jgi:hypothetical protein
MKKVIVLCFIICHLQVIAHPGGHGCLDQSVTHWSLSDGQTIDGHFLYGQGKQVMVLETPQGELVRLQVSALTPEDQLKALEKMRLLAAINQPKGATRSEFEGISIWIVLSSVIGTLLAHALLSRFLQYASSFRGRLMEWTLMSFFTCMFLLLTVACKKLAQSVPIPTPSVVIPRTRTSFLDSSFAPYRSEVTTSFDNSWYRVASNGIPSHNMMVGITSWQQQVPIFQRYSGSNSWSIPLQPEYATIPLSTKSNLMKGAVAIAVNGIPIFNALNNRGEDAYAIGELDNWGGHCGRADDYHYHGAPFHLSGLDPKLPIAFGLDGFPVYGTKEPDGSVMAGLDTCHGHVLATGTYHYHGTTNYPYVIGAMRGKVTLDPATPAPENQILPQAFAKAARPATTPLRGATIIDFKSTNTNAYSLTYRIGSENGYVHYDWDAGGKFTYTLVDTSGVSATSIYQR